MFENLSNKNKVIILLCSLPIVLLICYNLAIKETVDLARNCSFISERLTQAEDAPRKIDMLEHRLTELNAIIGEEKSNIDNLQQELLSLISDFSKKSKVIIGKLKNIFPAG